MRIGRPRRGPVYPPIPHGALPPARTLVVPGRGEMFLRDTGGDGRPVLLLHGWLVTADLNWCGAYDALTAAGYRVLAPDHRGHGRGIRSLHPFRLSDCAADAAALLAALGTGPAIVVGYSMGGAIAQLLARDHPESVGGLVLSATCQHFQDAETRGAWKWMWLLRLALGVAPRISYATGFARLGLPSDERGAWWLSEMLRLDSVVGAEAGRELGRFDSRPWLAPLAIPAAVVVTSADRSVSPTKQRELAAALNATVHEAAIDHLDLTERADLYNPALLDAIAAVSRPAGASVE
ncbi:MAG: alpha/beta fold hydrolase [Solirubrobacteraceae bacterium]